VDGGLAEAGAAADGAVGDAGLAATVLRREPALAAMPVFDPPVPRPERISSTFGPRWKFSISDYDLHPGIDYVDALGTPLTAIGDGTVEGVYPTGSAQFPEGGNVLVVRHPLPAPLWFHGRSVDRIFAVYVHLDAFAVAAGDTVTRGQVVGTMGRSGVTDYVQLHFEIRVQTMCSLQFQTLAPTASCVTGFDPHVHPFLFVGGRDEDAITIAEIPPAPGEALALRYTAGRGDLDLDVIDTDLGTLGFVERRGLDATTLARLDDFDYGWLRLDPRPFTSIDERLVMELHFPTRPRYVEMRDVYGKGVRVELAR
jgi:murein DD-endopeptidase MepM/ murein hydrolase activator NlpD